MLKIKDNVDLKDLEKFGFKPKYDEDTGELNRYIKVFENDNNFWIKIEVQRKHIEIECGSWFDFDIELIQDIISFIYDLTKADLVEKVGE
jgi:hypothetical protein